MRRGSTLGRDHLDFDRKRLGGDPIEMWLDDAGDLLAQCERELDSVADVQIGDLPRLLNQADDVAGGALGLLSAAGVDIPWAVALAVGAVAIGLGIVAAAVLRRRVGGMAFLGLVLAAAAVAASSVHLHLGGGVGTHNYSPVVTAQPNYRVGIGDLDLDLSNLLLSAKQTQIKARVGIGNLHVTVPKGVSVRIVGHAGVGDVTLLGHDTNGHGVNETVSVPGGVASPKLVLDARVDVGRVLVTRS